MATNGEDTRNDGKTLEQTQSTWAQVGPPAGQGKAGWLQSGTRALKQSLWAAIRDGCRHKIKFRFCLSKPKGVLVTN